MPLLLSHPIPHRPSISNPNKNALLHQIGTQYNYSFVHGFFLLSEQMYECCLSPGEVCQTALAYIRPLPMPFHHSGLFLNKILHLYVICLFIKCRLFRQLFPKQFNYNMLESTSVVFFLYEELQSMFICRYDCLGFIKQNCERTFKKSSFCTTLSMCYIQPNIF